MTETEKEIRLDELNRMAGLHLSWLDLDIYLSKRKEDIRNEGK